MNRQFGEQMMRRNQAWLFALIVAMILSAGLWLTTASVVQAQSGYNYTVQEGDSWDTVASRTGVSVEALQEANPDAVRENGWLLVGETLLIPSSLSSSPRMHRVESGESWNSIAQQYGISVSLLRAANPNSIRTGNILYRGEELIIPPAGASVRPTDTATTETITATATAAATPTVETSVTATMTEEATEEATATATSSPTATPTSAPTATSTTTATPTLEAQTGAQETDAITETETLTESATDTITDTEAAEAESVTETEAVTETEELTSTEPVTAAATLTATEEMTASGEVTTTDGITDDLSTGATFDLPACPERFADYAEVMTDLINSADPGIEAVAAFLSSCDALVEDGVVVADLNGDGGDDLVAVYQNPSAEQVVVEGDLVIFNSDGTDGGYTLGYRARAAGAVRLLAVEDINLDELIDVAWVDTTCGASTCFDTVNVRSWDGTTWADWTDGTITMAYAEINLTDASEESEGQEIELEGGIYGSVGAGPQRSRTEIWASVEGGPYSLLEKTYGETECLYHTVLDANRAFLDAPSNGFEAATALYTQAVEDEGLIKCWVRNDELDELRSFSLFRLALIAGYNEDSAGATAQIEELSAQYPGSIYDEVGQVWLTAYEDSGDAVLACEEVTAFAEENSAAWEMLADYGYTNPSFEAVDVCPILDLSSEAPTDEAEETEEATE